MCTMELYTLILRVHVHVALFVLKYNVHIHWTCCSCRRPTHASTVDSSSTYTTASRPSVVRGTAKKVKILYTCTRYFLVYKQVHVVTVCTCSVHLHVYMYCMYVYMAYTCTCTCMLESPTMALKFAPLCITSATAIKHCTRCCRATAKYKQRTYAANRCTCIYIQYIVLYSCTCTCRLHTNYTYMYMYVSSVQAAHPRPQARRPRVRLEALTQPHPDTTAITDSQQETENDQQV